MTSKRWFELECRHCRQCFVDMAKLLFHRCPNRPDAQNRHRSHANRRAKGKVATKAQRAFQYSNGAP
jgi:hypothetical protein